MSPHSLYGSIIVQSSSTESSLSLAMSLCNDNTQIAFFISIHSRGNNILLITNGTKPFLNPKDTYFPNPKGRNGDIERRE
jgi:hypothetical protein